MSEVLVAMLPRCEESDQGDLVAFGQLDNGFTYSDGSKSGALILVPRFLWSQHGEPEELFVAWSKDEFTSLVGNAQDARSHPPIGGE